MGSFPVGGPIFSGPEKKSTLNNEEASSAEASSILKEQYTYFAKGRILRTQAPYYPATTVPKLQNARVGMGIASIFSDGTCKASKARLPSGSFLVRDVRG